MWIRSVLQFRNGLLESIASIDRGTGTTGFSAVRSYFFFLALLFFFALRFFFFFFITDTAAAAAAAAGAAADAISTATSRSKPRS